MSETSDPGQPPDPAPPKRTTLDLKDVHRWTRTEMQIYPLGRVLIGPMSLKAVGAITQVIDQKPRLPDTEVARGILKAVAEIPDAPDSWEGRELTEEEIAQVDEARLEEFAVTGLGRQDWFVKEEPTKAEPENLGPAIPELVSRLRRSIERMNKQVRDIIGSVSPLFSSPTRALIEQTERLARLGQFKSPLFQSLHSPLEAMREQLERTYAGMEFPGLQAAKAIHHELDQINQQNKRFAELVSPGLGAIEMIRNQTDATRLSGIPGEETRRAEERSRQLNLGSDPFPEHMQKLLEGPKITPIGDHFKALSRENRELRDGIADVSTLMEGIRALMMSALDDTLKHQAREAKATARNFWIAIAGVAVGIVSACGPLAYSIFSGRSSRRQQDQVIQALQQQNIHLSELVKGQKATEARISEERSEAAALLLKKRPALAAGKGSETRSHPNNKETTRSAP